jgi:hypothetical protein
VRFPALLACLLLAAPVVACGSSVADLSGAGEPLQVELASHGQFFEGAFPSDQGGPAVASIASKNNAIRAGEVGKNLSGTVQSSPHALALAFHGLGHGYWVVPVGAQDPISMGYSWSALTDFSRALPAGPQTLDFAAGDGSGKFGPVSQLDVQVAPFIPTGHVVASLIWGNNADLDLHVVSPTGEELDPKHVNTALSDAGADQGQPLAGNGTLDRDSNADCVLDSWRAEDVVWPMTIEPGTYLFRVDMFSACGVPSANFRLTLYVDGTPVLDESGRLLDVDADGGGLGSGLYVGSYTF